MSEPEAGYVSFTEEMNDVVIAEERLDKKILMYAIVGSISSLQFGYHIAELNLPEKDFLECYVNFSLYPNFPECIVLDKAQFSFLTGLLPLFSLIGTFFASVIKSKLNSKDTLMFNNIFFVIGSLFSALSFNYTHLLIGRALCGLSSGVAMVVVPIFLSEIAPLNYKGALGTLNQLSIVFGIVLSMTFGFFFSWRYILSMGILLSFVQLVAFSYFKNNYHNSIGYQSIGDPQTEVEDDEYDSLFRGIYNIFRNSNYRKCAFLLLFLHISQQMSGINSIMYFSTTILKELEGVDAKLISLLLNIFQLLLTLFIVKIIEVKGRRVLFIYSCLLMSVSLFGLAISMNSHSTLLPAVFMFLSIAGYSIGLGALPFILIGEFFEGKALTIASTISLSCNLMFNFFIAALFLPLTEWFPEDQIGSPFLIFAIYLLVAAALATVLLPETKNNLVSYNQQQLNSNFLRVFGN